MLNISTYMLQAVYDWALESDLAPYLLADADKDGVNVPGEYIEEGTIVLNISDSAVEDLVIDNEGVSFVATFSGEVWNIFVPRDAILGLYDSEFGQGIYASEDGSGWFINEGDFDEEPSDDDSNSDSNPGKPKKGGPNLRVVK